MMALSTSRPMQSTSENRTMLLLVCPKTLSRMNVISNDRGMDKEVMIEFLNPMAK